MRPVNSFVAGIAPFLLFPLAAYSAPLDGPSISYADGIVVEATPPVRTESVGNPTKTQYSGVASMTGALTGATILGTAISPKPAMPAATTYPSDGGLHEPQPAPFIPGGGIGTNGTEPVYNVKSDYDYQSIVCSFQIKMVWIDGGRGTNDFSLEYRHSRCIGNGLSSIFSRPASPSSQLSNSSQPA